MTLTAFLSIFAGFLVLAGYAAYVKDIIAGKVRPSRSARLMLVIVLIITLLQQHDLGSGWLLALTAFEAFGSIAILALSLKRGVGGITRLDIACYALLAVDILVWITTKNTLLALHLSVLADFVAFVPVLIKTWRDPWSETPAFCLFGAIAVPLNVIANGHYSYGILLFPLYLFFGNALEVFLIFWRRRFVPISVTK